MTIITVTITITTITIITIIIITTIIMIIIIVITTTRNITPRNNDNMLKWHYHSWSSLWLLINHCKPCRSNCSIGCRHCNIPGFYIPTSTLLFTDTLSFHQKKVPSEAPCFLWKSSLSEKCAIDSPSKISIIFITNYLPWPSLVGGFSPTRLKKICASQIGSFPQKKSGWTYKKVVQIHHQLPGLGWSLNITPKNPPYPDFHRILAQLQGGEETQPWMLLVRAAPCFMFACCSMSFKGWVDLGNVQHLFKMKRFNIYLANQVETGLGLLRFALWVLAIHRLQLSRVDPSKVEGKNSHQSSGPKTSRVKLPEKTNACPLKTNGCWNIFPIKNSPFFNGTIVSFSFFFCQIFWFPKKFHVFLEGPYQKLETTGRSVQRQTQNPMPSRGRRVYLPTWMVDFCMVNV